MRWLSSPDIWRILDLTLAKLRAMIANLEITKWRVFVVGLLLAQWTLLLGFTIQTTGTLGFPLDDGYIYSTYISNLFDGYPFQYNPGEYSGGMTGFAWFLIVSISFVAVRSFAVQPEALIWASYLAGFTFHGLILLLSYRLTAMISGSISVARLATLLIFLDSALLWGVASGLEVPLAAFGTLMVAYLYLRERRTGRFKFTPYAAGLLVFARPELALLAGGIAVIFLLEWIGWPQKLLGYDPMYSPPREFKRYALRAGILIAALPALYLITTGLPLPTSFYGKVHAVTSVELSAGQLAEHGKNVIENLGPTVLVLAGLALVGYLTSRAHTNRAAAMLVVSALLVYACVRLLGGPWIGQMHRYVSPLNPLAIAGLGFLAAPHVERIEWKGNPAGKLRLALALVATFVVSGFSVVFARNVFAVHVQNTNSAHVEVGKWLSVYTPADAIVASEPIGAAALFSGRRTVDIYGLTTPAMLGHYQDWDFTWRYLQNAGADYFIFYPRWFPGEVKPEWLKPVKTVVIENNKIVGDSILQIYFIDWDLYGVRDSGSQSIQFRDRLDH